MARGNKRGGKRGGRGGGRGGAKSAQGNAPSGAREDDGRGDHLEKADMHNARFFSYYKAQRIVPDEEWDAFAESLRSHLPVTFRVAGSREIATTLNATIRDVHVPSLSNVVFEGQPIPPPVQIPWYPDGLAWQFNVPKRVLRRQPEFKKFHNFLVFETEVGNISRQEAVSMLPPLFLDVQPHHIVMDMCAAPGSKTAQLLEALHSSDGATPNFPSGLLLANDSDAKRTHLLIHQSARLPSPSLLVTNLDASNYPTVRIPVDVLRAHEAAVAGKPKPTGSVNKDGKVKYAPLKFDRILCDVPCSGDGTIRKNMGIWKSWAPMDGNGLHGLQLRILQRAMNLLKEDGRIVYSTCSLNPIENEAVITQALLAAGGEFELVDTSSSPLGSSDSNTASGTSASVDSTIGAAPSADTSSGETEKTSTSTGMLSALIRRPGLTTWRPATERTGDRTFESYEEFMASDVDDAVKGKMGRGHWPPDDQDVARVLGGGGVERLHLERCMRVYPHVQDSGGFFVAVLERRKGTAGAGAGKSAAAGAVKRDLEVEDVDGAEPESKRARIASEDAEEDGMDLDRDALEAEAIHDIVEEEYVNPDVVATGSEAEMEANDVAAEAAVETRKEEIKSKREGKKMLRNTSDGGGGVFRENPYTFLKPDDPVLTTCLERLHINSTFPIDNVLVRNPEGAPARGLYLVNNLVKGVVQANNYERLRLTAAGTKVFAKQDSGTAQTVSVTLADGTVETRENREGMFRVLGEGLPVVLPYVEPEWVIQGDMATLRTLVESYYPLCAVFGEPFRSVIEARPTGSHIVQFPLGNLDGAVLTHDLVLPIWKSNVSLTLMIDKKAKSALSLRLFGTDITTAAKNAKEAKETAPTPS